MGVIGAIGRLLRALFSLAVLVALAGLVAWAVLPGGPLAGEVVEQPRASTGDPTEGGDPGAVGDTSTPPPAPEGTGPWDEAVVTVDVRNPAAPGRNVTPAVVEAVDYWEANAGYGDYVVDFRVVPGAAEPDVVVRYNATIDCPAHDDAIGCAPLLESDSRIERPIEVQIRYDPADNHRQVRNTAIHEFGHVLGLTHCEEPYWVMASSCEEPIPDAPDADERDLAWRDRTITVHVDERNVPRGERDETREQVGHALAYLSNRSDGAFPNVTLRRVDERYAADVVVTFPTTDGCRDGAVTCYSTRGRDFDGDGHMEYYTSGTVRIDPGSDVEARGWYVGWALSNLLSPPNVPDVFVDASYRERRSRWWE